MYGSEAMSVLPPARWEITHRNVLGDGGQAVDWADMRKSLAEGRNVLWLARTLPRIENLPENEKGCIRIYTGRFARGL